MPVRLDSPVSATAERAAVDLHKKLSTLVPNLVSVIVGKRTEGIPSLIIMLSTKLISTHVPQRFRGMRVVTCFLPPRR
jgi:hypothetical protein